ncbi:MAG: hypothetical protein IPG71_05970 [bacterium]|nr:hypothetical protein [bacterium]
MGGRARQLVAVRLVFALCVITAQSVCAMAPDVIDIQTYDERGEFQSISLALDDTLTPGVYLTGVAVQAVYQAYAVKLDSASVFQWARTWGTTNHMFFGMWRNGVGSIVGYTTANPTHDYKVVEYNRDGTLHDSWDFGGNTTADRALGACYYDENYYLIAGLVNPGGTTPTDGSLTYVSSIGDVEWSRIYSSSAGIRRVNRTVPDTVWLYGVADSVEGRGVDFWMRASILPVCCRIHSGGVDRAQTNSLMLSASAPNCRFSSEQRVPHRTARRPIFGFSLRTIRATACGPGPLAVLRMMPRSVSCRSRIVTVAL